MILRSVVQHLQDSIKGIVVFRNPEHDSVAVWSEVARSQEAILVISKGVDHLYLYPYASESIAIPIADPELYNKILKAFNNASKLTSMINRKWSERFDDAIKGTTT